VFSTISKRTWSGKAQFLKVVYSGCVFNLLIRLGAEIAVSSEFRLKSLSNQRPDLRGSGPHPDRISACYIKTLRSSELGSRFGAHSQPILSGAIFGEGPLVARKAVVRQDRALILQLNSTTITRSHRRDEAQR
jgi:hypothetical protein